MLGQGVVFVFKVTVNLMAKVNAKTFQPVFKLPPLPVEMRIVMAAKGFAIDFPSPFETVPTIQSPGFEVVIFP